MRTNAPFAPSTEIETHNRAVNPRAGESARRGQRSRWLLAAVASGLIAGALLAYPTQPTPRILVNEQVSAAVVQQFARRGAEQAIIINQNAVDPNNDAKFDIDAMKAVLAEEVPMNYTGPACIDWEGLGMIFLTMPSHYAIHQWTIVEYVKAIDAAKRMRPNAQWGFYNLPMASYVRDDAWRAHQLSMQPIYDASDVLFPSVYDMYATAQAHTSPAADLAYVRESVALALEVADGKPVFPYIWPRYHLSNSTVGIKLIPGAEFKSHVAAVFEARFEGRRVAGIVWWGADRYFRWLGQQNFPPIHPLYALNQRCRQVFTAEIQPGVSDNAHFTAIHKNTLRQLAEVVQAVP